MRQMAAGKGRGERERRRERQTISHEGVESQRGKGHPKGDLLHRGIRQREHRRERTGGKRGNTLWNGPPAQGNPDNNELIRLRLLACHRVSPPDSRDSHLGFAS